MESDAYLSINLLIYVEYNTIFYCLQHFIIPPATKLGGVYWNHPVRPSVRLSVCLSVCPSVDARLGKMVSSA